MRLGIKRVLFIMALIMGPFIASGEVVDPSLLFSLDFDNWTTNATFGKGSRECHDFGCNDLQMRMFPGIKGAGNALKLRNDEYCRYSMAGNFIPSRGTISLWVSPQTWKASDDRFQIFFTAKDDGYRMIVYKYMNSRILFYLERLAEGGAKKTFSVWSDIDDKRWYQGSWHKIDALWDTATSMRIFVDGNPPGGGIAAAEQTFSSLSLPDPGERGSIFVGTEPGWRGNGNRSDEDQTAFDEIRVYNRMLTEGEIRDAYEKYYPSIFAADPAKNKASIPLVASLGDGWTSLATRILLMAVAEGGVYPFAELAAADMAWDGNEFAISVDVPAVSQAGADPCVEVVFSAAENEVSRSLVVTQNGKLEGVLSDAPSWMKGIRSFSTRRAHGWRAELRIPVRDVPGFTGQGVWRGNVNIIDAGVGGRVMAGWGLAAKGGLVNELGTWHFSRRSTAVRIDAVGLPWLGGLSLRASMAGARSGIVVKGRDEMEGGGMFSLPDLMEGGAAWRRDLTQGRHRIAIEAMDGSDAVYCYNVVCMVDRPVQIAYRCFPSKGELVIECGLGGAGKAITEAIASRGVRGTALLRRKDGSVISRTEFVPVAVSSSVVLSLPSRIEAGTAEVAVELSSPSGAFAAVSGVVDLRIPDSAVVAESDLAAAVPEPWIPVRGDEGGKVEVWGRTYRFPMGPFPAGVVSAGEEVLAGPVELLCDTGGGPEVVSWDARPVRTEGDGCVRYAARQPLALGRAAIDWVTAVYYDGVCRTDFSVVPLSGPLVVRGLALRYRLPPELGRFVMSPLLTPWSGDSIALDFDPAPGMNCKSDFMVWATGFDRGFLWWPESSRNWVPGGSGRRPIRLSRAADGVQVDIEMIGREVSFSVPISYSMAFMASPSRRPPAGWRTFHLNGDFQLRHQNAEVISWGSFDENRLRDDDCTDFVGMRPRDPLAFTAYVRGRRGEGVMSLVYSQPTYLSSLEPEFDYYGKEWEHYTTSAYAGSKAGIPFKVSPACPNTPYSDFAVRKAADFASACPDAGGVYYDLCWPTYCDSPLHGCGGVDVFGRRYATSTAWGLRRVLGGVYARLHARGGILVNHNHSYFNPICHNFSDYWYPGEQYESRIEHNAEWFYGEGISREIYQSELSPRQKGVGVIFLPQYLRAWTMTRDLQRRFPRSVFESEDFADRTICPLALHDIPVSAAWINGKAVDRWWAFGDFSNLSKARFVGYWEGSAVRASEKDVLVSRYSWADGNIYKCAFVVGNMTKRSQVVSLFFDRASLGVPAGEMVIENAYDRTVRWRVDDRLDGITVAAGRYLVLGLRQRQGDSP